MQTGTTKHENRNLQFRRYCLKVIDEHLTTTLLCVCVNVCGTCLSVQNSRECRAIFLQQEVRKLFQDWLAVQGDELFPTNLAGENDSRKKLHMMDKLPCPAQVRDILYVGERGEIKVVGGVDNRRSKKTHNAISPKFRNKSLQWS